jgi:hypothetical protein
MTWNVTTTTRPISAIGFRSYSTSLPGSPGMIDTETRGHRTPAFAAWWRGVDRSAQQTIQEMRNAELKKLVPRTKKLVPRTAAQIEVEIGVSAAKYPDRPVNDGDTVTTISWAFNGGALHGQPVLKSLRDYLQQVGELVEEAEGKLNP